MALSSHPLPAGCGGLVPKFSTSLVEQCAKSSQAGHSIAHFRSNHPWMTLKGGVLAMCEIAEDATVSTNGQQLVPEEVANADSCQEDSPGSTDCSINSGSAISIGGKWDGQARETHR